MFVITEKVKPEHVEICPIRQGYLRSIIEDENTVEQINTVTKDVRDSIIASFTDMSVPTVDIDSDSVVEGDTSTAKMFNVVMRNAKVSIGSNVTIVNANFSDCTVHIPSNSVVYSCSFYKCRITLNVLKGVLIQSSSFSEQDIIVCAHHMIWLDSVANHSYRIICDTLLFGNNKSTSKSATRYHKIDAVGKTVILFNTSFHYASDIQVTQPKSVELYRQSGYYSSAAPMTINKLHLSEDSVTHARSAFMSISNKGVLYINGQSEDTVKYSVGKNSKVSTAHLRLHWYYRKVLSEINVADNVVADIISLRRSTETLYIKEGFEGIITNYTGTNRGGTVIVRKVHGVRPRCT